VQLIPGVKELRVRRISREAEGVVSVTLARDDGSGLPEFTSGAHIDLVLRNDLIRQYSLCSDPGVRDEWTIAVLREADSRGGSEYVHTVLRPGMSVGVVGPRSNFPLVEADEYLFIAGGIGITPLLPMVREMDRQGRNWAMLYGGRTRASMAFLDDLARFSSRVTVVPQDEYGLLDLRAAISPLRADAAVYCCGPEPLISAVESTCAELGRPAPHVERFKARQVPEDALGERPNGAFRLVLSESGKEVTVPPDKSIIEVLEEEGVFVLTACEEGICGTCETEVVSGIPDHRDDYLTPEERATNKTMMVCVGRSKTPVLVLKL
jgi:ferredoxin-NADP reductase